MDLIVGMLGGGVLVEDVVLEGGSSVLDENVVLEELAGALLMGAVAI